MIKFVNSELYDVCKHEIKITIEDLDNIDRFKSQYANVPDEHEAERFGGNKQPQAPTIAKPQIQATHNIPTMNVQNNQMVQQPVQTPVQPQQVDHNVPYNEPLTKNKSWLSRKNLLILMRTSDLHLVLRLL